MSWVRIHDGAMENLKVLRLNNAAFRLWIRGLCYCQTALTDGLIPREALCNMGAKLEAVKDLSTPQIEGRAPLWEPHQIGFKVHDYLDWNDPRDKVLDRKALAKQRKDDYDARKRATKNAERTRPFSHEVTSSERGENAVSNQTKPNQTKDPLPSVGGRGRGQPPMSLGLRKLKVWRWMIDDFTDRLGEQLQTFGDVHDWLAELDARPGMPPAGEGYWPWLQAEFARAAVARGVVTLTAPSAQPDLGKQSTRLMTALSRLSDTA